MQMTMSNTCLKKRARSLEEWIRLESNYLSLWSHESEWMKSPTESIYSKKRKGSSPVNAEKRPKQRLSQSTPNEPCLWWNAHSLLLSETDHVYWDLLSQRCLCVPTGTWKTMFSLTGTGIKRGCPQYLPFWMENKHHIQLASSLHAPLETGF